MRLLVYSLHLYGTYINVAFTTQTHYTHTRYIKTASNKVDRSKLETTILCPVSETTASRTEYSVRSLWSTLSKPLRLSTFGGALLDLILTKPRGYKQSQKNVVSFGWTLSQIYKVFKFLNKLIKIYSKHYTQFRKNQIMFMSVWIGFWNLNIFGEVDKVLRKSLRNCRKR